MSFMKIREYKDGFFTKWFKKLSPQDAAKVMGSIAKVENGNSAACKPLDRGISEIRNHSGPGYRVYYGMDQGSMIVLGGSLKRDQKRAIEAAVHHWQEFKTHRPEVRRRLVRPLEFKK